MSKERLGGREPYARIYASAKDHPRHLAAGLEAEGLWKRAMGYCAEYLTNGFVPKSWMEGQAPVRVIKAGTVAGLWEKLDNGYLLHDYLDHNRSREQVEEHRESERLKKQGQRAGSPPVCPPGTNGGTSNGTTNGTGSGSPSGRPRAAVIQLRSSCTSHRYVDACTEGTVGVGSALHAQGGTR